MPATASASVPSQSLTAEQLSTSPEVGMSAAALAALHTFMAESQALEEMAAAYLAASELEAEAKAEADAAEKAEAEKKDKSLMDAFPEQGGMSQFWNDEDTARRLAREAVDQANGGTIVCVSSPSVFLMLKSTLAQNLAKKLQCGKEVLSPKMAVPNPLLLLEYDTRFAVFPEFRAYDYARPLAVPGLALAKVRAAVILVDPPYVNAECFEKTAQTVRAMSCDETKYIVSTGWVVRASVQSTLNARIVNLRPGHRGGLATPFRAYVNYESADPDFAFDADPENGDNDGTAFAGAGGVAT